MRGSSCLFPLFPLHNYIETHCILKQVRFLTEHYISLKKSFDLCMRITFKGGEEGDSVSDCVNLIPSCQCSIMIKDKSTHCIPLCYTAASFEPAPVHCSPFHRWTEGDWYRSLLTSVFLLHRLHYTQKLTNQCSRHQLLLTVEKKKNI